LLLTICLSELENYLIVVSMNNTWMIQILDYQDTPPRTVARFWWSDDRGISCDHAKLLKELGKRGIMAQGPKQVYPRDGRVFFDALLFRYTGLVRAQAPVLVDSQGGDFL
jgi:hypothetical protein